MGETNSAGGWVANLPALLIRYRIWVGLIAILLCAVTWAVDLFGVVYQCPFCRAQRTVIGLLGLLFIMPHPAHWLSKYFSAIFAVFGLVVGGTQHFRGWVKILAGEFEWGDPWFMNSWLLSGFAIGIIVALTMMIWSPKQGE